jgi:hypothetical protein
MHQDTIYHRQNLFDSRGLLPSRNWKSAVSHMLLLVLVVFLTEISTARADGLFDFQMKLAEKGNAEAQFKIGEMYETGFGTTKNMKLAEEWIGKAAAQGHETAGFKQLYWDMRKNGLSKANKAKYEELVSKAKAENGYAQYYIGKLYAAGAGVPVDKEKALDFYNQATLKGIVEAERESTLLREDVKKAEIARAQAEQKRQAELKAKREEEARRAEAERQAAAKKAEAERAAKLAADKRKQASAKQSSDNKSQQAEQAKLAAEQQAAEKAALEAKRQALLQKREQNEEERKAAFESDPCAGKSARFLSTCH